MKSEFLTVRLTEYQLERLKAKCKEKGLTVSQLVRQWVNQELKDEE